MKVRIIIKIETDKGIEKEMERLTRYLKTLDVHPDGLFSVAIEEIIL